MADGPLTHIYLASKQWPLCDFKAFLHGAPLHPLRPLLPPTNENSRLCEHCVEARNIILVTPLDKPLSEE